jgi:hypothetical protein
MFNVHYAMSHTVAYWSDMGVKPISEDEKIYIFFIAIFVFVLFPTCIVQCSASMQGSQ